MRRIPHPPAEVLLLVVCATIADCDDYDHIAAWGKEAHLDFLRGHLPYEHRRARRPLADHSDEPHQSSPVLQPPSPPGCGPVGPTALSSSPSMEKPPAPQPRPRCWRRRASLHLVSAFATTTRTVLGQEAVPDKANELTAIPTLLARLAEQDGLRGALVSIDAIATNGTIAHAIRDAGADYLLAVKANQPSLRAEVEACFEAAPPGTLETHTEHDKGHGRVEQRTISVVREVDWLHGDRRFPGELRLPGVACIIRVQACIQRGEEGMPKRAITSPRQVWMPRGPLEAIRGHWGIENRLHWVLDVIFNEDQSRLRKGFGAKNMAVVRHFALNLVRADKDPKSIKLRRKIAGWKTDYLSQLLSQPVA